MSAKSLKIAVIGVGLIGGSLARALKRQGITEKIIGVARKTQTLDKAMELGVIDQAEMDPANLGEVDIIVIATPMRTIPSMMQAIASGLSDQTVITDVGSAKRYVVDAAFEHLKGHEHRFVPAHPIAGTEKSGVEASFVELFQGRNVILTPHQSTTQSALNQVRDMWLATGASILNMDVDEHDKALAATSHLPHMVAYALVHLLCKNSRSEELLGLAAGGFYDFTRIASSDPTMWVDISLTNRKFLVESLVQYRNELSEIVDAVESGDADTLYRVFSEAKRYRELGLRNKNDHPQEDP